MTDVAGRTAFITGGASTASAWASPACQAAPAKLVLVDLEADALGRAMGGNSRRGPAVETFVLDVRDQEAYARVADDAEARLGPVSLLVNNRRGRRRGAPRTNSITPSGTGSSGSTWAG